MSHSKLDLLSALARRALTSISMLPLLLFVSMAMAQQAVDLNPRQVAKTGEVVVPNGMHLITDRAGLRWLLPIGMATPPQRAIETSYFSTRTAPQERGRIGSHVILSGPINAQDAVVSRDRNEANNMMRILPASLAETMDLEKRANLHAQTSPDLIALGDFGPAEFATFKLPYIPIPRADMQFAHVSDYATNNTKELLTFRQNGVEYVRFFIHPNYAGSYADLITRYGIVYHYLAMSTSSPRSLIMVDPEHVQARRALGLPADVIHWTKVSIHKKIDGSVRINTDKKARRAIIMSEAISEVPSAVLRDFKLRFMLEPGAFQPPGKLSSTIHREVSPELVNPGRNRKWIPAFILQNTGADAVPGLNVGDMARVAQMPVKAFVEERIIRPLLRSYLGMGILEGLPGELHTQNFYYEVENNGRGWLPTGEVMFKDNDGFRYDTEMALRRGRNMNFFARFEQPFVWGKFSNTIGTGAEGIPFLGSWYYKLIRNVNGFETIAAYMMRAINQLDPVAGITRESMQQLMDTIAGQEAERLTGIRLTQADMGFGADKGLNKVLNEYRLRLALEADTSQRTDVQLQQLLARQWDRLKTAERTSSFRRSMSREVFYLLHRLPDGSLMIESRTPRTNANQRDPVIGFAMVESPDTVEGRGAHAELNEAIRTRGIRTVEAKGIRPGAITGTVASNVRCEMLFTAVH